MTVRKTKITKLRNRLLSALLVCLCAALLSTGALALNRGSLSIRVEDENDEAVGGFVLHFCYVADKFGIKSDAFKGADVKPSELRKTMLNAQNAKALHAFALENGIEGERAVTGKNGTVKFSDLESGIYLVYAGEENTLLFEPFLVYMPTVVNGVEDWSVEAVPKADAPGVTPTPTPEPTPEPTPDVTPGPEPSPGVTPEPEPTPGETPGAVPTLPPSQTDGMDTNIPQTGMNLLPVYLLMGLGTVCVVAGLIEIYRGRSGKKDD